MPNNSGLQGLQDRARTATGQQNDLLPHPSELFDMKNRRTRELYAYRTCFAIDRRECAEEEREKSGNARSAVGRTTLPAHSFDRTGQMPARRQPATWMTRLSDSSLTRRLILFCALNEDYRTPISATVSAICGHIGGFPLDSIKTRMQTHPYNGIMDCVRNTYRVEGLAGFWRGVGPPILSVLINKTISFQVYEDTRHSLRTNFPTVFGGESIRQYGFVSATSGAVSGSAIAILSAPFELIKVRMQLDRILGAEQGHNEKQSTTSSSRHAASTTPSTEAYAKQKPEHLQASIKSARSHPFTSSSSAPSSLCLSSSLANTSSSSAAPITCAKIPEHQPIRSFVPCSSSIHAAKEIVRARGLFPGVYFGASLQLTRDVIGTSVYFGTYEVVKRNLLNYGVPAFAAQAISGGTCGVFCWLVIFPIDFVKSVRQKDGLSTHPEYKSAIDCCRKLYKKDGWRIFYRGITVTLCRAFPVHGCNLLVYEQTRAFITRYAGIHKDMI